MKPLCTRKSIVSASILVSLTVLVFCVSSANAGGVLTAEPPKEAAFRKELKKDLSTFNITVEVTEHDLASNLNRIIPKELYQGSATVSGLTTSILRNGPIVVSAADNYLYVTLPVTISLHFGTFESPKIANKLKFRMNAGISPDWKIKADVFYLGLSELLADRVGIGPVSIKPRNVVDGIIQPVQRILSDLVSQKLNEQYPLKAQITAVWNSAYKPILLDKTSSAWLRLTPRDVLMYPFYAQKGLAKINLGLTSFAELVVGPEPHEGTPLPLPALKLAQGADRTFHVILNTELFYKDVRSIALPLLLNRELGSDGKSIILKDLELYGNGDRLVIKVEATGSLEGLFFLHGRPVFNSQTNLFSVEDVDFEMETRDLLLQSADWFLHSTIRSSIQEKLNIDLTQRLTQVREMAGKAMERYKLGENLYLTGTVRTIQLSDVLVQQDRLLIQANAEGETTILFK